MRFVAVEQLAAAGPEANRLLNKVYAHILQRMERPPAEQNKVYLVGHCKTTFHKSNEWDGDGR